MIATWKQIGVALQPGRAMFVPKGAVQHPRDGGLLPGADTPAGQLATFKLVITPMRSLRVREYQGFYMAEIVDGTQIVNAFSEVDGTAAAVSLGTVFGLLVGKSVGATLIGAIIGGVLAATLIHLKTKSETGASPDTCLPARTGLAALPPRETAGRSR